MAKKNIRTNSGPSSVSSHYLGERGCQYAEGFQDHHLGYRLQAEYFQPHILSQDIVLDFGCGNGGILKHIKCKEISGLEVNPYTLSQAQKLGVTARIYSNVDELPNNCFTVIYSNHVLEHVPSPVLILQRLKKSLKRRGRLILILPLDDWRSSYQQKWLKDDHDRHLYTWTPRLIANLLYEAGYEVDDVKVITSAWSFRLFPLYKIPIFGKLARRITAILLKRRQIKVLATKKSD